MSKDQLSIEELEVQLAARKKEQAEQQAQARKEYEAKRNATVINLCLAAMEHSKVLQSFHKIAYKAMEEQAKALKMYGGMRKNSKGGFQIISEDGQFKVSYKYAAIAYFDERADKAAEMLKDFVLDHIAKKDKTASAVIMDLLARNAAGQLEFSRVSKLYKRENEYDDKRWRGAIQLFKESYQVRDSKMQLYFFKLNDKKEFELIDLNFSGM